MSAVAPLHGSYSERDVVRVCPLCGFTQRRSTVAGAELAATTHRVVSHSGNAPIVEVSK